MKNFLLILILLFTTISTKSQVVMSSIGVFPGTSSSVSAIQFKGISTCVDIQTGVAVLKGERGSGEFAYSCEVSIRFNSLGIKLFPNPVNNVTKIKFTNTPPLNEVFMLQIYNTDGQFITSKKEIGYDLFQGITIDLGKLNAGTYVLKIESLNFVDAVKFIKAN